MHGRELPALSPAAASMSSISRGEAVYGGAQVGTPGGMKAKTGAVTSIYHLYAVFFPLCRTIWPHLLPVRCTFVCPEVSSHPLYPLLSTKKQRLYLTTEVDSGPKAELNMCRTFATCAIKQQFKLIVACVATCICWTSYVLYLCHVGSANNEEQV